ncbi:sodium-dependent bicarbonate transport family permease [Hydrogenophaga borbori]|uniref:Sodium-dependent bicarbonate transport family permease n=1 Tax=Hydrogenophaga borbori TaxID=2294117 RepID=A0A372EFX3_9BURK|nr:sodium-dependent bicarbonate transport family permease [Hydrogenophaga borbori]RFP77339.1 sodium-dependent bicarbonate transport family permease [Hydrogenophaga borbori]
MTGLLDPAILFFVFGVFAGALRSNLEIPPAIGKFLSLYLLMALGLKGGFALAAAGLTPAMLGSLAAALFMAFLVPALGYAFLRHRVSHFDAAAVAAAYGSVSAVSFVAATQHLENLGLAPGGHMTVAMVLMESPAILMAVLLANAARHASRAAIVVGAGQAALSPRAGAGGTPLRGILRESFTDGAQLLLLGSLVVGWVSGDAGRAVMQPFAGDLFKGLLAFFLLDMGLLVARNFADARRASPVLIAYAVLGPLTHAAIALALARLLGLPPADTALLMVLSASASYIVVPAVLRHAVPEANPSLYLGLSLGLTFPLNILLGIPLYTWLATAL